MKGLHFPESNRTHSFDENTQVLQEAMEHMTFGLNDHAPIVSTLEKGEIRVNGGTPVFAIRSGVIEVLKNKVIILAKS